MNSREGENLSEHCWTYFDCSKKVRDQCPIYQNGKMNKANYDCWFDADIDITKGGPAKRGPCYECDVMKTRYPELQSFFEKKQKKTH